VNESDQPSPESIEASELAELALVSRVRAGEARAWSEFVKLYQDRIYGICYGMVRNRDLADDLTQDAFLKVIKGLHSFDGRSKFSTWVYRVVTNVCLSKLRSEKIRRHASLEGMTASGDGSGDALTAAEGFEQVREQNPSKRVQHDEDADLVLEALSTLEPDQRAVLLLCDCRGLPYEQIAEVLGVAVGTVKSRLFRARGALREAVENRKADRG
jgi:RNA polymerase sigma-70 factor (ECF subfamily)